MSNVKIVLLRKLRRHSLSVLRSWKMKQKIESIGVTVKSCIIPTSLALVVIPSPGSARSMMLTSCFNTRRVSNTFMRLPSLALSIRLTLQNRNSLTSYRNCASPVCILNLLDSGERILLKSNVAFCILLDKKSNKITVQ